MLHMLVFLFACKSCCPKENIYNIQNMSYYIFVHSCVICLPGTTYQKLVFDVHFMVLLETFRCIGLWSNKVLPVSHEILVISISLISLLPNASIVYRCILFTRILSSLKTVFFFKFNLWKFRNIYYF